MTSTRKTWTELKELRQKFLETSEALESDYWFSDELLQLYDESFARRIAWKWDAVLEEIDQRSLFQPLLQGVEELLDWGCGSGVAAEVFLKTQSAPQKLRLFDRSPRAMDFAKRKLNTLFPQVDIRIDKHAGTAITEKTGVLLSHVINEVSAPKLRGQLEMMKNAAFILWVEPGAPLQSRRLSELRDSLFSSGFHAWAPCLHAKKCPVLESANDWCHFFASPPNEVHHSPFWREFSIEMGVDLRSSPFSFLLLSRRPPPEPQFSGRILERARLLKGSAEATVCTRVGKLEKWDFDKRKNKAAYKMLDKKNSRWALTDESIGENLAPSTIRKIQKIEIF